ncbi:MAG TPA: hypothetical protein VL494_13730 [Steroidobacteraceae bacterium]|jgi:hypothetical protein|nr:hypothetical protein [Steroidobacteraceae bacterium]
MTADIGILGASKVVAGVVTWQVNVAVGNDNDDVEPGGEVDVFQTLGVSSVPYPKTSDGYAEGLFFRDCGGKSVVCFAGRDTRDAGFTGKLRPGDTTIHATGPKASAQCFLKNEKKQAGLAVDDAEGKSMLFLLDGKNKKAQIAARGAMIQIGDDGSISLIDKSGAGLVISNGKVRIVGNLSLPGMTPGLCLMQGPPTGSPGGSLAIAMTAVQNASK